MRIGRLPLLVLISGELILHFNLIKTSLYNLGRSKIWFSYKNGDGVIPKLAYMGGSAKKGILLKLRVYKRVGISPVEVHVQEMVLLSTISCTCKRENDKLEEILKGHSKMF